jgi:hypothetical protein
MNEERTDDKRDDFNFPIVNFPFICCNIPAAPAYGVYISQLIRYSRACGFYQDFLDRGLLLTRKLLNQGCLLVKWKPSLLTFYGRYHDLVDRYVSVSQMTTDMFIKEILIEATSSGISYQLRDIYSICRCCWNVATYEWKVHNGKIEIISFVVKLRS